MDIGGSLLLVGCGKMGGALLSGWLERGAPADRVVVIEPQPGPRVADFVARGVTVLGAVGAVNRGFRPKVVVLAVKPQSMDEAAAALVDLAFQRDLPVECCSNGREPEFS